MSYLHGAARQQLAGGRIPVLAFQGHGQKYFWAAESECVLMPLGWKALPSPGRFGWSLQSLPASVFSVRLARLSWASPPPGCAGHLAIAVIDSRSIGKLLVFSAYCFTGQRLSTVGNAAIPFTVADWVVKLKLPWIVASDWENLPVDLECTPWSRQLDGRVVAW